MSTSRTRPSGLLASVVVSAFVGLGAPVASTHAANVPVENCNETGPGSIQAAIRLAAEGDVIDLRGLTCGRIEVSTNSLLISRDTLTFKGPGRTKLSIDATSNSYPAFHHYGRGTLRFEDLTIENGSSDQTAYEYGGCVYSFGSVELIRSDVRHCQLLPRDAYWLEEGLGGAIYAERDVRVEHSRIQDSHIINFGRGGAIFARGNVTVINSLIEGNSAYFGGGIHAGQHLLLKNSLVRGNRAREGGGLYLFGSALIENSTIADNQSSGFQHDARDDALSAAALSAHAPDVVIVNSTISGNSADYFGAMFTSYDLSIYNSTVVYNHSAVSCDGGTAGNELHLESSILARSTCSHGPAFDLNHSYGGVTGSHNLIESSRGPVPADTITAVDPRLAPLAINGGWLPTHLPLRDSPVVDRGSNVLELPYDQRGQPFRRERGTSADIGAVERRPRVN